MVTFCPFNAARGWYVIRKNSAKKVTDGGINLTDKAIAEAEAAIQLGLVLNAGPARLMNDGSEWPMTAKAGDLVVIEPRGGKKVEFGEGDDKLVYWFFSDNDILGVVTEECMPKPA